MIIRAKRVRNFTILGNEIFSSNLSLPAIGLLAFILSKPDHWDVLPAVLWKMFQGKEGGGKQKIYNIINELIDGGWVKRIKHGDGRVEYRVFDHPTDFKADPDTRDEGLEPVPDSPDPDCPDQDCRDVLVRTDSKQELKDSKNGRMDAKAKGSRLSNEWKPSHEMVADAKGLGLTDTDIRRTADEFRDYWTDRTGKGSTKRDWRGTWRNRCRVVAERMGRRPAALKGGVFEDPMEVSRSCAASLARADWERVFRMYRNTSNWPGPGPEPGVRGCLAPPDMIEQGRLI